MFVAAAVTAAATTFKTDGLPGASNPCGPLVRANRTGDIRSWPVEAGTFVTHSCDGLCSSLPGTRWKTSGSTPQQRQPVTYPRIRDAKHRVGRVLLSAAVALVGASVIAPDQPAAEAAEQTWGPRDPWLRPYDAGSIWNTPIGSGARYVPTGYPVHKQGGPDPAHLVRASASDPTVDVHVPYHWRDRCNPAAEKTGRMQIPREFFVPDAQLQSNGSWKTPNDNGVVLDPDGRTLRSIASTCRDQTGGPIYAYTVHTTDLYGDGIKGAHGASQISVLGGAIRAGELTGDAPIAHALSLIMHAETAYMVGSDTSTCYRWPASRCDAYAGRPGDSRYKGTNPEFRMGALLAIPPDVSCSSLGIQTNAGQKLCWTMKHYGGYWTDDSAWDANYIKTEAHTPDFEVLKDDAVRHDLGRVIAAAQVVANNGPDNIGGGGRPLAPRHVNSWAPGRRGTEGTTSVAATLGGKVSSTLATIVPTRVLDSRQVGRRSAGSVTEVSVDAAGVPGGASGVVLNVTAVEAGQAGYVTVFPCGGEVPVASNLNFAAGQTIPNSVIAKTGDGGRVCLYTSADVDLVVDVNGYVPSGSDVKASDPVRVLDSRQVGRRSAGSVTEVSVDAAGVPGGASGVVLNVTAVEAGQAGYVTVYPCLGDVPLASNLNFAAGQTIPNSVIVATGGTGRACLYTSADVDLVVDVNGYVS
jgi:hypothetical protein